MDLGSLPWHRGERPRETARINAKVRRSCRATSSTHATRSTPVLTNIDDGPSKEVVLSNGWAERPLPTEQLYDLLYDPNEANNLAGEPVFESVLIRHARAPRCLDARDERPAP